MERAYFAVCAGLALVGALGLVASRNVLHGALFLVLTILAIAALFAQLAAPFIAILQVIIYAGAIIVLFLFVIMLLNLRGATVALVRRKFSITLGVCLGLAVLVEIAALVFPRAVVSLVAEGSFGSPDAVAGALLGPYLYAFELASVLLLAAMVGAVVMARSPKKDAEEED